MTTALAFLFVLGVLVFVHELGHFLVARWHGVRVITFSLGFGPKLVKFQRGATEYCISVVPLGGYVKLAGETAEDAGTGAPDEFLSKSKWVRFQVYIAGPVMNILLAVIVLAGVLSQGATVPLFESSPPVIGSVAPDSPAAAAGLQPGDLVVSVDGVPVPTWEDFMIEVVPRAGRELVVGVDRGGQRMDVRVTPSSVGRYELGEIGVAAVIRPQILEVTPGPARNAGLQSGDVLVALNGTRGLTQEKVIETIRGHADRPLTVTIERTGREQDVSVVPEGPDGAALIGVKISEFEVRRIDPTVLQATQMSLEQNWANAVLIGRTLRGLFTRDTPMRQLMGPVAIAEMSGTAAAIGWVAIFNFMAMISLNLGLLNLMPVPVLDGGHIAILAVEGVARRDLSMRVKERILMAGAALIVLLMVTVIYNDIARLLR
jgi:regulator of sigma E protease